MSDLEQYTLKINVKLLMNNGMTREWTFIYVSFFIIHCY